jgi:hypothetical protein
MMARGASFGRIAAAQMSVDAAGARGVAGALVSSALRVVAVVAQLRPDPTPDGRDERSVVGAVVDPRETVVVAELDTRMDAVHREPRQTHALS